MTRIRLGHSLMLAVLLGGCSTVRAPNLGAPVAEACFPFERLAPADRAVADSLLAHALDHEALYTLAAPLKPMSSVGMLTLRIAPPDSLAEQTPPDTFPTEAALARVAQWHRIAEVFHCGSAEAVLVPYRNVYDGVRYLQLTVVDRSRVHALMDATPEVWGYWGVSGEAAPSVIVGAVENAESYRRFRGYGLLFGYPRYAIDFFVAAAQEADRTEQFVTRDFFHVPVHAAERGYFTYAIPKGHTPSAIDSARYHTAMNILSAYRDRRAVYLTPDSTLDALGLLRDWRSQGLPLIQTPSL